MRKTLAIRKKMCYNKYCSTDWLAPLAQMDRALASDARCRRFESAMVRHVPVCKGFPADRHFVFPNMHPASLKICIYSFYFAYAKDRNVRRDPSRIPDSGHFLFFMHRIGVSDFDYLHKSHEMKKDSSKHLTNESLCSIIVPYQIQQTHGGIQS